MKTQDKECRLIAPSDFRGISFNDDALSVEQLEELFSIPGTVGWILGWSYIIGLESEGDFFIQHEAYDNDRDCDALLNEAAQHFRRMRITLSLKKHDHARIMFFDDRHWKPSAVPGMSCEMTSPARASWTPIRREEDE